MADLEGLYHLKVSLESGAAVFHVEDAKDQSTILVYRPSEGAWVLDGDEYSDFQLTPGEWRKDDRLLRQLPDLARVLMSLTHAVGASNSSNSSRSRSSSTRRAAGPACRLFTSRKVRSYLSKLVQHRELEQLVVSDGTPAKTLKRLAASDGTPTKALHVFVHSQKALDYCPVTKQYTLFKDGGQWMKMDELELTTSLLHEWADGDSTLLSLPYLARLQMNIPGGGNARPDTTRR